MSLLFWWPSSYTRRLFQKWIPSVAKLAVKPHSPLSERLWSMFYAVAVGRKVGVFSTWAECKLQVDGFKGCRYKKFATETEAREFAHGVQTKSSNSESGLNVTQPGMSKRALELKASIAAIENEIKAFQEEKERELKQLRRKLEDLCQSSDFDETSSESSNSNPTQKGQNGAPAIKRSKLEPALTNSGEVIPDFITDSKGFVQVFTDGACEKNGQKGARAAIGVWWNHHHHLNISAPILELNKQTNNSAEIQAATEAVRVAKASDVKRLCINTDSQFLINCITLWIKNWKKRGWTTAANTPVKNKEDLMLLDEELSDPSIEVTWNHVRGHAGIEGNEMADSLARAGIRK